MGQPNKIARNKSRLGVREPRARATETSQRDRSEAVLFIMGDTKDYAGIPKSQVAAEPHPRARGAACRSRSTNMLKKGSGKGRLQGQLNLPQASKGGVALLGVSFLVRFLSRSATVASGDLTDFLCPQRRGG